MRKRVAGIESTFVACLLVACDRSQDFNLNIGTPEIEQGGEGRVDVTVELLGGPAIDRDDQDGASPLKVNLHNPPVGVSSSATFPTGVERDDVVIRVGNTAQTGVTDLKLWATNARLTKETNLCLVIGLPNRIMVDRAEVYHELHKPGELL